MTSLGRRGLYRLFAIAAAWAFGEALVFTLGLRGLDIVVPAALAVAAYLLTRDMGWTRPSHGGQVKYWRGRRVDERDGWRH